MATDEDEKNGYTKDPLENGNVKVTLLKSGKIFELEEPGFDKRDSVYAIIQKLVQNIDSKEIQKKKSEIAKLKKISIEQLHEEMKDGILDDDFVIEIETMVRDKNMNLLAADRDYMMEVIGTAMNKSRAEWPEIEKGLKLSEGKFLYDACLSFLLEIFQEMQGDRKK